MSGRRLRNAIRNTVLRATGEKVDVILAGLSNVYTSYIVTPEEYMLQKYEAASTIFGPHTLTIYIDQFEKLANAMIKRESIVTGPLPPSQDNKLFSLQPKVYFDTAPNNRKFGDVTKQPLNSYRRNELVNVTFISGNPRNDLHHESSYFTVEKLLPNENWKIVATDSDWNTW